MTKALDAAIRAGCNVGRLPHDQCSWPKCGCIEDRDAAIKTLRAALPAEPDEEMLFAVHDAIEKAHGMMIHEPLVVRAAYLALRAHILGEDA